MFKTDLNYILRKEGKKPILCDFFFKANNVKKTVVIFCHGYKGFKDWGAWNLVAKEFSANNFFFLKFNFSHNGGTMENPIDFPDLDAFGNNNYSHEQEDLDRVLGFIRTQKKYSSEINYNEINLIGHSRGGGSVLIKASEDKGVKKVITWSGVSNFKKRFNIGSKEFKNWMKKGVTYIENSRTKQMMPHYFQFFEDFKRNETRFNIESAVNKLKIPYLIIHGSNDKSVLPSNGADLFSWNKNNKMETIKGGDQVFSSKHPWKSETLPEDLKQVVYKSIEFLV